MVRCLNEETSGSCRNVFRPWPQRTQAIEQPLRSNDDDPELLLHVPFDGSVKITAICIIGGPDGRTPSRLKVITNRDDVDFSSAPALPAAQEWDLAENGRGEIEYPTQVTKFNGVHSLDLLFSGTLGGGDQTELTFVGFKGEFTERKRRAVEAVYESRAQAQDHQVPGGENQPRWDVS